jgi:hypothetical protein
MRLQGVETTLGTSNTQAAHEWVRNSIRGGHHTCSASSA